PFALPAVPLGPLEWATVRVEGHVRVEPDVAIEALRRQAEPHGDSRALEVLVPAVDAALAILDVRVAQHLVHRVAQGYVLLDHPAVPGHRHPVDLGERLVLLVALFSIAALEAVGEEGRGVARDLAPEQVEREREPEVQVP